MSAPPTLSRSLDMKNQTATSRNMLPELGMMTMISVTADRASVKTPWNDRSLSPRETL